MEARTQLLVLPDENVGSPDVTIMPESFPIKVRPGEVVEIIIIGPAFFGLEIHQKQQKPLRDQCSSKGIFINL